MLRTFLCDCGRHNGACDFLRRSASKSKRVLFFPQRRRRTWPIRSAIVFQPMGVALRNGVVCCVKCTQAIAVLRNVVVAAALRLRYFALCCVTLRNAGNHYQDATKPSTEVSITMYSMVVTCQWTEKSHRCEINRCVINQSINLNQSNNEWMNESVSIF